MFVFSEPQVYLVPVIVAEVGRSVATLTQLIVEVAAHPPVLRPTVH